MLSSASLKTLSLILCEAKKLDHFPLLDQSAFVVPGFRSEDPGFAVAKFGIAFCQCRFESLSFDGVAKVSCGLRIMASYVTVSYTHLTLPTNREV